MNSIYFSCQGESHKISDKPCQDCSWAESSRKLSMAIVCDGHGGERYFRSQYGSEFAVKITRQAIYDFVESMPNSVFNKEGKKDIFFGSPFTSFSADTATKEQENSNVHKALRVLFSSIISQWNIAITKHALENGLNEWESNHVEQKYKDEFLAMRQVKDSSFEKTYGCTLMAYVQTPDYWFAFHLGDGKCISLSFDENKKLVCDQPIPWDERCFLNKTTSICDSEALEEFRYCYQGDGHFPLAVFLGSDGMDDTFGDGDDLTNFYIQLYKFILKKSKRKDVEKELRKSLPEISRKGSKDDMSIAAVYDDSRKSIFFQLTDYQIQKLKEQSDVIRDKIYQLEEKLRLLGDPESLDKSKRINYDYLVKDLDKAKEQFSRNESSIRSIKKECLKFQKQPGLKSFLKVGRQIILKMYGRI